MNNIYFSIILFIAVCFLILSAILILKHFASQEIIKIQSEEIEFLIEQYKKKCKELLEASEIKLKLSSLSQPSMDQQNFGEQEMQELLKCTQMDDNDWEKIKQYINDTQHQFVDKLMNTYPTLSREDIHFILLMRMNVTNSQIAAFYHIQLPSLATKRYRLVKKMGLRNHTSISEFINNLFKDESKH